MTDTTLTPEQVKAEADEAIARATRAAERRARFTVRYSVDIPTIGRGERSPLAITVTDGEAVVATSSTSKRTVHLEALRDAVVATLGVTIDELRACLNGLGKVDGYTGLEHQREQAVKDAFGADT